MSPSTNASSKMTPPTRRCMYNPSIMAHRNQYFKHERQGSGRTVSRPGLLLGDRDSRCLLSFDAWAHLLSHSDPGAFTPTLTCPLHKETQSPCSTLPVRQERDLQHMEGVGRTAHLIFHASVDLESRTVPRERPVGFQARREITRCCRKCHRPGQRGCNLRDGRRSCRSRYVRDDT